LLTPEIASLPASGRKNISRHKPKPKFISADKNFISLLNQDKKPFPLGSKLLKNILRSSSFKNEKKL